MLAGRRVWRKSWVRCPRETHARLAPARKAINWSIYRTLHRSSAASAKPKTNGSETKEVTIQQALRKFYLRVHPDLFSNHPEQREVNEKSFQLLMAILDDYKDGHQSPMTPPTPIQHNLSFYFRKPSTSSKPAAPSSGSNTSVIEDDEGEENDESVTEKGVPSASPISGGSTGADTAQVEFGLAQVVIRSPIAGDSPENKEKYLHSQLAQLFEKCGVPHNFSVATYSFTANKNWDMEVSLLHFATQVSEVARERAQRRTQTENDLDMERTTFYIQHKLRILYEFPMDVVTDFKRRIKLEHGVLKQLETTMKMLAGSDYDTEALRGLVIVIGTHRGIDYLGRLNLHHEDDVYAWREALYHVDMNRIERIKETGKHRDQLETTLATTLGLAYFYSDYSIANTLVYTNYINDVKLYYDQTPALHDQKFDGMGKLKIRIVDPLSHDERSESLQSGDDDCLGRINYDKTSATILVPIGTHPRAVFEYINQNGKSIVYQHDMFVMGAEEQHTIVLKVKRRFRLRFLSIDAQLSAKQIRACCQKLLNQAGVLLPYLEGTRIAFGFEYDIKEDDGTIVIKHDWLL